MEASVWRAVVLTTTDQPSPLGRWEGASARRDRKVGVEEVDTRYSGRSFSGLNFFCCLLPPFGFYSCPWPDVPCRGFKYQARQRWRGSFFF